MNSSNEMWRGCYLFFHHLVKKKVPSLRNSSKINSVDSAKVRIVNLIKKYFDENCNTQLKFSKFGDSYESSVEINSPISVTSFSNSLEVEAEVSEEAKNKLDRLLLRSSKYFAITPNYDGLSLRFSIYTSMTLEDQYGKSKTVYGVHPAKLYEEMLMAVDACDSLQEEMKEFYLNSDAYKAIQNSLKIKDPVKAFERLMEVKRGANNEE